MKTLLTAVMLTILAGASSLFAQENIVTAGGEATGTEGSVSYTIGQMVYTSNTGSNGNLSQGVQQPFEISEVTGIEEAQGISLQVLAYPNPTTDYLTLSISNNVQTSRDWSLISYQLFDMQGKLLQNVKATGQETEIKSSQLAPANYFLKVLDNNKEIKTFKIIKN